MQGIGVQDEMNYIVIMTDGMRADFALDPLLMPNVYKFLNQFGGMEFTNAYTTTTWTLAALMSLYTGRLPSNNGVDDITYSTPEQAMKKDPRYWRASKCQDADFLPWRLKMSGYRTVLFSVDQVSKSLANTANHHFARYVRWDFRYFQPSKFLKEPHPSPFFYHIYDHDGGHDPFGRYPRTTLSSWMRWKETHQPITYLHLWRNRAEWSKERLYECCCEQVKQYDEKLGTFLNWLVAVKLHENTTVILTSDHGTCLWDHNWVGHVQNVYEEIVRVPLVVCTPEVKGLHTVTDIVSIVDIAPTILGQDRFGDGVNLFNRQKDRAVFFEFTRVKDPAGNKAKALADPRYPRTRCVRGVRHQNFKFIFKKTIKDEATTELYDLSNTHVEDDRSRLHNKVYETKYLAMLKETFGEF